MAISTSAPIERALVSKLRSDPTIKAALPGGMHEGFAPEKARYPVLTYTSVYSPYIYDWTAVMIVAGYDLNIWSDNSVDAKNVDALIAVFLHDASLTVDGQTTLICRRTADLRSQDVDEEGRKVYMVGGTYEIWTDQPI